MMHSSMKIDSPLPSLLLPTSGKALEQSFDVKTKDCVGSLPTVDINVRSSQMIVHDSNFIGENSTLDKPLSSSVIVTTTVPCTTGFEQLVSGDHCRKIIEDMVLHHTDRGQLGSTSVQHEAGLNESAVLHAITNSSDNFPTDLTNCFLEGCPLDHTNTPDLNGNFKMFCLDDESQTVPRPPSMISMISVPSESAASGTVRAPGLSSVTRYTCLLCPLSYKRLADLNRHMRQKHGANLRNAMRWRTLMLDHCNWVSTAVPVEPLDLTTTRINRKSYLSTTVVTQHEPLDLSVKSKKFDTFKLTRCSGSSVNNKVSGPASLRNKAPAMKLPFSSQSPISVDVDLPRSPSKMPTRDRLRQREAANSCVKNIGSILNEGEVNGTDVAQSSQASRTEAVVHATIDANQGMSVLEAFNSNVKEGSKKCSSATLTYHRCSVCRLPLKKKYGVLCCHCAKSNFNWQNHVQDQQREMCSSIAGTVLPKIAERALMPQLMKSSHCRSVEGTVADRVKAVDLLLASGDSSFRKGSKVYSNVMDKDCLTSTHCDSLSGDSFNLTVGESDELAASVNEIQRRIEAAGQLTTVGTGEMVVPTHGQQLQSFFAYTELNVGHETNDDESSERESNCRPVYESSGLNNCGNYRKADDNKWLCQSLDCVNMSTEKPVKNSITDDKADTILGKNIKLDCVSSRHDYMVNPIKCVLLGESVEQCQQSQMTYGMTSLENSMKINAPEIQLSATWTVSSRRLKRFCCSACPYRSNFRSDVVRHIRHKHPEIGSAQIFVMNPEDAAATLADYLNTWAKKKFVLVSSSRPNEKRRKGLKVSSAKRATEQSTNDGTTGITGSLSPYPLDTFEIDSIVDTVEETNITRSSCVSSDVSELSSLQTVLTSHFDELSVRNNTTNVSRDEAYRDIVTTMSSTTSGHVIIGSGSSRYRCHHCPYVSRNRNDYLDHRLFHRERPSASRFQCEQCDYWVAERRLLSKHYKVHHCTSSRPLPSPVTSSSTCTMCDVIKDNAENMEGNESGPLASITPCVESASRSSVSVTDYWPSRTMQSAFDDGDGDDDLITETE